MAATSTRQPLCIGCPPPDATSTCRTVVAANWRVRKAFMGAAASGRSVPHTAACTDPARRDTLVAAPLVERDVRGVGSGGGGSGGGGPLGDEAVDEGDEVAVVDAAMA